MATPTAIEPTQQQRAARISAQLRSVDALERHIRRVVDSLPPLTEAQRTKLAALLRPSAATEARAA